MNGRVDYYMYTILSAISVKGILVDFDIQVITASQNEISLFVF